MSRLIDSLASTAALSAVFSDASLLRAMLDFEVALARAEAQCGIIPAEAADAIAAVAGFDIAAPIEESLRAGTPAIPLVRMLKSKVAKHAADFVHWGATSQDVTDSAMSVLLVRCRGILARDHARLETALRKLSDDHAGTVMSGRTLLQPAPPVTFGLKAAHWLNSANRCWRRVDASFEEARILQFGGASGTLAALGDRGLDVASALAQELGLQLPEAPWHTSRDRLAALLADLAILTATLAKMALDAALLMQTEVGEAAEPGGNGRGGSSAMPHKRNPTACMLTIAAARRAPGHVSNFLNAMVQEHERALGGWQSEWVAIEGVAQAAGVALESMVEVAEGLTVNTDRMRSNIPAAVFAEKAVMQLAASMGRDAARGLVEDSLRDTGSPPELAGLVRPEDYLGVAEILRQRLLADRGT
jgi:3-carboxy-cis,cis-muconate cycloisomerase